MSQDGACRGPGFVSPGESMTARREKILYTLALYIGTGIQKPDCLAPPIDADPESPTYSQITSRLEMPGIGDERHHMGRNASETRSGSRNTTSEASSDSTLRNRAADRGGSSRRVTQ